LKEYLPVICNLSFRLPPRRPLGPTTKVVIREFCVDDELPVVCEVFAPAGGRATRNPVGFRDRLAFGCVPSFDVPSFLRLDIRAGKKIKEKGGKKSGTGVMADGKFQPSAMLGHPSPGGHIWKFKHLKLYTTILHQMFVTSKPSPGLP
jgi:hypothetical protein